MFDHPIRLNATWERGHGWCSAEVRRMRPSHCRRCCSQKCWCRRKGRMHAGVRWPMCWAWSPWWPAPRSGTFAGIAARPSTRRLTGRMQDPNKASPSMTCNGAPCGAGREWPAGREGQRARSERSDRGVGRW